MKLNLRSQYRYFQRYRKIAEVLLKNGLGIIIDWLELSKFLPFSQRLKKDERLEKINLASRIRRVLQDLGPTYIKLGQLLSTRADLLPPHYIQELRKLQDRVSAEPFEKVESVLIEQLGKDYQHFFKKIDNEPRAAASIAQTYHAVLHDGTDVILKVQRPGIETVIRADLEILKNLAILAEEKELISGFLKPHKMIEEFNDTIKKELDFTREAASIEKFSENFKGDRNIVIPRVFKEFSGKKLLVLEEIKGSKLSELDQNDSDIDGPALAILGARALIKQVLIDGFFHADPHPGNIFIIDKDKLAFIDFGMMGQLTMEDQDKLSILFIALLKQEINIIIDILLEMGDFDQEINLRKFKLEIKDLVNRYYGINLSEFNLTVIIDDIERLLYNFKIRLPEEFFLLFRAVGVSQGVGYSLDPSFNMVEVADSFLNELILSKVKPDKLLDKAVNRLWGFSRATRNLPGRLNSLLNKIISDEFTIRFKHLNLEELIHKLDIASNRLSISLIISALIIGSSMILQTNLQPLVYGIPLLGFIGYSAAGIMGLWLVISIFRSGKF